MNTNLETTTIEPGSQVEPVASTPAPVARRRGAGERGEGVISTAIAVLIVALLGAGMWAAFDGIFNRAIDDTEHQMELISD